MEAIQMEVVMRKIGNSQGVILPKQILRSMFGVTSFEVIAKDGTLILTPKKATVRGGWEESLRKSVDAGNMETLIPDVLPGDVWGDD
jgi:antitoxin component of MazEF toxin-antitoxin module